jgi:hypothetical protein
MSPGSDRECASCGSEAGARAGVVACASKSYWKATHDWHLDDIRSWEVWLCDRCRRSAYAEHLAERKSDARRSLKGVAGGLAGVGGTAVVLWLLVPPLRPWFQAHPRSRQLSALVFGILVLVSVIALLRIPIDAARMLIAARKLREVERSGVVPEGSLHQAAAAVAGRILRELERDGARPRRGFELPAFQTAEEYPAERRGSGPAEVQRLIRASAVSREKLDARLLPEERKLLAEREAAGPNGG